MKFPILLLLASGCYGIVYAAAQDEATPKLTPIAANEKVAGPQATKFAPLAYFNQNCARCHGEYGSFYPENFAAERDDASLHAIIEEMAEGPAQAPLAPAELDAVAAWHRALRDKKPFVVIVKAEKTGEGWQLSGEISPNATLQINGKSVEVNGSNWTYNAADGALKLRATKGEVVTELDANAATWAP